jgi:hypothetical protein
MTSIRDWKTARIAAGVATKIRSVSTTGSQPSSLHDVVKFNMPPLHSLFWRLG